jgi:glyoxylase-like metal-dependent hydrolase (beta-lactamase superfamily II)
MRQQKIGDLTVDLVADIDSMFIECGLFPDATPELIRAEAAKLGPAYLDVKNGGFFFSVNSYVIRRAGLTILVDTCIGNHKQRPYRADWDMRQGDYLERLERAGVSPDQVDFVMCTHMHADHVGWNTRLVNGEWVPTFPKAQYLMVETEYKHWLADAKPTHGSFEDSVLPVVRAGQATMIRNDHSFGHGIDVIPASGHTPGNVYMNVQQGKDRLVLGADVVHHPVQFSHPTWNTRACVDPVQSCKTRIGLMNELADSGVLLATSHFVLPTAGHIYKDGAAFRFEFLADR